MMCATVIAWIALLMSEPTNRLDGAFLVDKAVNAEDVSRNVNKYGRSGVRSDGVIREIVDGEERIVILRLVVPKHYDADGEFIRLMMALEDIPLVKEMEWL
jgi:hypothetical protein